MKLAAIAVAGILSVGIASAPLQAALDSKLAPGKYVVTVSPAITEQAADRIENQLDQIAGIGTNDAKPDDSTVHFTVEENAQVDVSRVKDAISMVVAKAKISDPMIQADDAQKGKTY